MWPMTPCSFQPDFAHRCPFSLRGDVALPFLSGRLTRLPKPHQADISPMHQNSSKFFLTSTTHVVISHTSIGAKMPSPKLTKLELKIMETLWTRGSASIREIQEDFPERDRPAYTTIQTTVYRLEGKKAVRRVKKVGNFHIFEAVVSRNAAQRKLIDDLLA